MTWRVVVADRVAASGLELLSKTPDIEVVDVAGKPAELDTAIAGAHALIVRSETRVTASLMARAPHLRIVARARLRHAGRGARSVSASRAGERAARSPLAARPAAAHGGRGHAARRADGPDASSHRCQSPEADETDRGADQHRAR